MTIQKWIGHLLVAPQVQAAPGVKRLFREDLIDVVKGLEFQCIPRWIKEKHRRLLTDFSLKTDVRRDYEIGTGCLQAVSQRQPVWHCQNRTKMRHRYIMAVNRIRCTAGSLPRGQMGDYLMAEKIEVDPYVRTTALRTPKHIAVKSARFGKIMDRKSKVEKRRGCHGESNRNVKTSWGMLQAYLNGA
jgi:hypothetical protein